MGGESVEVKPETFLPFSVAKLEATLLHATTQGKPEWEEFTRYLEFACLASQNNLSHRIMPAFDNSHGADVASGVDFLKVWATVVMSCPSQKIPPMQERENLMGKAGYQPIQEETFLAATSVNFRFYLPVKTNWEKLDNAPFRPWAKASDNEEWSQLSSHMMIFTRGVTLTNKTDYFFREKIDVLLVHLYDKLSFWLNRYAGFELPPSKMSDRRKLVVNSTPAAADGTPAPQSIHASQRIQRVSLLNLMSSTGVWGTLLKPCEIQDPTFKARPRHP
eukprot:gene6762-6463_t